MWPALLAHLLPNLLHRDKAGCMGVTLTVGFKFLTSGSAKECVPYDPPQNLGLGEGFGELALTSSLEFCLACVM